ncbi:MAG: radical SAM protein [Candidatus Aenigmatarchaeota archaeon]
MERKRHALLINPWVYDFSYFDLWAKPLGLLYIASILRENRFEISFIDAMDIHHPELNLYNRKPLKRRSDGRGEFFWTYAKKPLQLSSIPRRYRRFGIPEDLFIRELESLRRPEIVLVTSGMTYWYQGVIETISIVKKAFPGIPVVLGGIYATLCYDHAVKQSGADYVVKGYGEIAIARIIRETLKIDLDFTPDPFLPDTLPYPAFDLLRKIDYIALITSRGCPFRCSYCSSGILFPSFRRRSPENVLKEILYWHNRFGVVDFAFYDDALLVNADEYVAPLLREIIHRNLNLRFHCPNGLHIRFIDEEIARLLYLSGFKTIRLGFEVKGDYWHEREDGKVTESEFIRCIKNLKKAGYNRDEIGVYIMCGLPGQEPDDVLDTAEFVHACGAKPMLAEYSPIPETEMWKRAVEASPFPIEEEPLFHNKSILCCRKSGWDTDVIRELKKKIRGL